VLTQGKEQTHEVQHKSGCAAQTYCKQTKQKSCLIKLLCCKKKVRNTCAACRLCPVHTGILLICQLRCYYDSSYMIAALLPFKPRVIQSFGTICSLQARHHEAQAADIVDAPQSTQDAQHSKPTFGAATCSVTKKPWIGHPAVQSRPTSFARASDQHQVMTAKGRSLAVAAKHSHRFPVDSLMSETKKANLDCVVCRQGLCQQMTASGSNL
jgi:hypothetical protein